MKTLRTLLLSAIALFLLPNQGNAIGITVEYLLSSPIQSREFWRPSFTNSETQAEYLSSSASQGHAFSHSSFTNTETQAVFTNSFFVSDDPAASYDEASSYFRFRLSESVDLTLNMTVAGMGNGTFYSILSNNWGDINIGGPQNDYVTNGWSNEFSIFNYSGTGTIGASGPDVWYYFFTNARIWSGTASTEAGWIELTLTSPNSRYNVPEAGSAMLLMSLGLGAIGIWRHKIV